MAGFAENLQFYRKRENMTQEDLAEKMEVSRQTVSKWESAVSYPEMEKILQLCDMFQCNMDTLMRGDAEKESAEDDARYDLHRNSFSKAISFGVGFIISGIAIYEILSGFLVRENLLNMIFLSMLVISVMIFVVFGMRDEEFRRKHPHIDNIYSEKEIDEFHKKFINLIAVGIGLIMVGTIFEVYMDGVPLQSPCREDVVHGIFMLIIAIAVSILTYAGTQKEKYEVEKYNERNRTAGEREKRETLTGKICGCIMLTAVFIFLGTGFIWNLWKISWAAFPLGGILCGIVAVILSKE